MRRLKKQRFEARRHCLWMAPLRVWLRRRVSGVVLDSRLQEFVEKSQHFFDRAVEIMPVEDREAMFSAAKKNDVPAGVSTVAAVKHEEPTDPRQSYKEKVEEMAKAAVQLLPLEQNFSTSWPAAGRSLLPHNDAETHPERTWAAVLGWIVLGSMPWKHEALFDKLQMRAAIAEIFSSMGPGRGGYVAGCGEGASFC